MVLLIGSRVDSCYAWMFRCKHDITQSREIVLLQVNYAAEFMKRHEGNRSRGPSVRPILNSEVD